jgi:hypothetical protein
MTDTIPHLRTPGVIAAELGVPLPRVLYLLRKLGHSIRPVARAGTLRLYDRSAVGLLRDHMRLAGKGARR